MDYNNDFLFAKKEKGAIFIIFIVYDNIWFILIIYQTIYRKLFLHKYFLIFFQKMKREYEKNYSGERSPIELCKLFYCNNLELDLNAT